MSRSASAREIATVRGQQIARPEARLRCNLCDEVEMVLRGWVGFRPGVATAREELELKDEGRPEGQPIMSALVSLILTNPIHRLPLLFGASVFGLGAGRRCRDQANPTCQS
jgi:hypothetical protein